MYMRMHILISGDELNAVKATPSVHDRCHPRFIVVRLVNSPFTDPPRCVEQVEALITNSRLRKPCRVKNNQRARRGSCGSAIASN